MYGLHKCEERAEEVSFACERGIHSGCKVQVKRRRYQPVEYITLKNGKKRAKPGTYRTEQGTALTCGCDCHESDYCHSCGYYNCQCDAIYDLRYEEGR